MRNLSLPIKWAVIAFMFAAVFVGVNAHQHSHNQQEIIAITSSQETTSAQSFDEVVAAQNQAFLLANIGTIAAITLASGFMGALFARRISQIKNATERFANGDFSLRLPVKQQDELGQVAQNFNQMSNRLQESYHRLAVEKQRDEAILQSMGEGLIAVDEKGQVVLLNANARGLLDLASQSLAGKEIKDLVTFYDDKKKLPYRRIPIYLTLHNKQPRSDILGFVKKEGAKILISVSSYPIVLDETIVGAIMVLRDVTREREVDRMKTEFISLASHQLRTPLSAIKWFGEMLVAGDAGKLNDDQLEFATNITDSTERMIQLVNSLLNISRIESGRIMVEPRPTDLRELVSGIINDLKAKTEEKQQNLIISVHSDLPKINLDPRLIGQVYLNLLTNAIKYTQKGGEISVFISTKDNEIVSQVTDNGYGIPKAQQAQLFQKFFRASNAVKVETDGTGLGLYLIKAIVESSGGKIWFESQEGKGSTFWFSLPLSGMKAKQGEVTLDA